MKVADGVVGKGNEIRRGGVGRQEVMGVEYDKNTGYMWVSGGSWMVEIGETDRLGDPSLMGTRRQELLILRALLSHCEWHLYCKPPLLFTKMAWVTWIVNQQLLHPMELWPRGKEYQSRRAVRRCVRV